MKYYPFYKNPKEFDRDDLIDYVNHLIEENKKLIDEYNYMEKKHDDLSSYIYRVKLSVKSAFEDKRDWE